jgi:hypothetical protein
MASSRYDESQVREAVAASSTLTETLRRLGLRPAGGNHQTLRNLIARYEISTAHFRPGQPSPTARDDMPVSLDQVLVVSSTYSRKRLKQRLYESGLKLRRCEMCGQGEVWNGQRMSLIIDHVNGVATDNRLENLRIVCPNCAATLDTHCGRKNRIRRPPQHCLHCAEPFVPRYAKQRYCSRRCGVHAPDARRTHPERRKVERPSHLQLVADLRELSMEAAARKYGVSSNAVRKWLRWYEAGGATA